MERQLLSHRGSFLNEEQIAILQGAGPSANTGEYSGAAGSLDRAGDLMR